MATGYASPSFASGPRFRTRRPSPPALIVLAFLALVSLPIGGGSYIFSEKRTVYEYEPSYGVDSPEFRRSLDAFGTEMVPNNRATALQNGDGTFAAIFEAIAQARESVNVELYIF